MSCSARSSPRSRPPGLARLSAVARQACYARRDWTKVGIDAQAHLWRSEHPHQTSLRRFIAGIRNRILDATGLSEQRLDQLIVELERHLAGPETLVIHPLLFQARARRR